MRFRRKDIGGQARSKYFSYLNNSYNSGTTTSGGSNNFTFEEKWLPAKLNADGSYTVDLARVNFTGLIVGQSDIIAYAASDYDGEDSGTAFLKSLNITSPKNDDILVYKNGQWINQEANFGSGGLDLEQLSSYLTENNYITSGYVDNKFVRLTGDTMTGILSIKSTVGDNFNEGIRLHTAPQGWSSLVFCGADNTGDEGTSNNTWAICVNNGAFGIGKKGNGILDGDARLWCDTSNNWHFSGGSSLSYNNSAVLHEGNYASILDPRYINVSGDTMTGALNFANATANSFGDDVLVGDFNQGGHLGIQGINNHTGIAFLKYGDTWGTAAAKYLMTWDGTCMNASSTNLFNNLNADLLDGYHEGNFFRTQRGWMNKAYIDLADYGVNAANYANYPSGTWLVNTGGASDIFINFSADGGSTSAFQLYSSYGDDSILAYRKTIDSNRVSGPWRQIITEMSIGRFNAGSATELQNAHTIWGQSFKGNNNVSGRFELDGTFHNCLSIYDSGTFRTIQTWDSKPLVLNPQGNNVGIYTTNPQAKLHVAGDMITNGDYFFQGYDGTLRIYSMPNPGQPAAYESETVVIQTAFDGQDPKTSNYPQNYPDRTILSLQPRGGRVAIGKASASQVLDVNGNILATGDVICYSDARLKSDIQNLNNRGYLTPRTYIKDGKKSIGFIAQEVKEKYPELIQEGGEYLSLNYNGITAVLEAQILELKEEINKLREEVLNGK